MEVPGIEGQETKNTALVNAPEALLTLMSVAVTARLHHVEIFIAVTIRRRLLANDGDLYFLQRGKKKRKFGYQDLKESPIKQPSLHLVRAIYRLRRHGPFRGPDHELVC